MQVGDLYFVYSKMSWRVFDGCAIIVLGPAQTSPEGQPAWQAYMPKENKVLTFWESYWHFEPTPRPS